jgi:hypothetical protein
VWASGPVWTGAENLAPTGIRSPDRPDINLVIIIIIIIIILVSEGVIVNKFYLEKS